jgi:hypothetical protein
MVEWFIAVGSGWSFCFCAAYLSIFEGFFLRTFERGLSNVDADDPDTKDGVRMFGGGARLWRCADAAW